MKSKSTKSICFKRSTSLIVSFKNVFTIELNSFDDAVIGNENGLSGIS